MTARLVEAQLIQDGTYPSAAAVFAEDDPGRATDATRAFDYDPSEPRDPRGRWSRGGPGASAAAGAPASGGGGTGHNQPGSLAWLLNLLNPVGTAQAQGIPPEEPSRRPAEPTDPAEREPGEVVRVRNFVRAWQTLKEIDPTNRELETLEPPGYVASEADVARMESAAREAAIQRVCDFLRPDGKPIGERGTSTKIRVMSGGLPAAERDDADLSVGGTPMPFASGSMVRLPFSDARIILRPVTSTPGSPAMDIKIPDVIERKLHH